MTKVTSVNLDEDAIEYFQSENINLSAWIRDIMEQRVTGQDVDIKQVRIRELERERRIASSASSGSMSNSMSCTIGKKLRNTWRRLKQHLVRVSSS